MKGGWPRRTQWLPDVGSPILDSILVGDIRYFVTAAHRHGWADTMALAWNWGGNTLPATPARNFDLSADFGRMHWSSCWANFYPGYPDGRVHQHKPRILRNLIVHELNTVDHAPLELLTDHGLTDRTLIGLTAAGIATTAYMQAHTDAELLEHQHVGPTILRNARLAIAKHTQQTTSTISRWRTAPSTTATNLTHPTATTRPAASAGTYGTPQPTSSPTS